MGAYTPFDGFMDWDEWRWSCIDMKILNWVFRPATITLPHTCFTSLNILKKNVKAHHGIC